MNTIYRSKIFVKNIFKRSRTLSSIAVEREKMYYDVVAVGGGPAGLSTAIRLKQLAQEKGVDLSVCVIEKAAEVGAHVLSGNVFETRALDELFPDWKESGAPIETKVSSDKFLWLTESGSMSVPNALMPSQLHNEGNYIISLSQLTRWLATKAEELGVEIYPGFAASEVLYNGKNEVIGVATRDAGIAKDGSHKDTYTAGIELHARQTIFAEGCRGSCSEELIHRYKLRKDKNQQTYGLGIKEVWEMPADHPGFSPGLVQHTLGWPLQSSPLDSTFGGTFLYHMAPNLVLLGMVVGLSYKDPYLNPYQEFQRWKHHPQVSKHIAGGTCVGYGARVLNEGGYHSIPKLTFPGGLLVGCSAGFLNSVKIKGSHTAIKSGMLAAEAAYPLLTAQGSEMTVAGGLDLSTIDDATAAAAIEAKDYEPNLYASWVGKELKEVRNAHGFFYGPLGTIGGMAYTAMTCFVTKGQEPWTFENKISDSSKTGEAKNFQPRSYPKADGKISFDLLTNLQRSGTNHDHDQPAHLRVKEDRQHVPSDVSITKYAGPERRFCPAGVYEYTEKDATTGKQQLVINAQNCVHCKCCSIKTPQEYIKWTVPEGGGGPSYTLM